ncbi:MAG: type III-B CRISPR-associated protein Cas10/Cmr2 [Candidatus Goldbacteria bacterium]|nr:type III-B CRISPR-associated protein Cas10/Cmr2 [Candidatus Goldiibacteriota bacterium]
MDKSLAYNKILAFLHDPPDKPIALSFKIAHEELALNYLSILLGEDKINISEKIKRADRIAAAIDRQISEESQIDFLKETSYRHILQSIHSEKTDADYELLDEYDKNFIRGKLQDNYKNFTIKNIEELFKKINNEFNKDYEIIYFYIWRKLFEELSKVEELKLINKFPADTRAPNHNIEDHLNLSSALVSDTGKLFIGIFTIGPVQEFISQSRKLKDLWAGSFLLSYFIFNAILPVADEIGPANIIYPDLKTLPLFDKWLKENKGINNIDYDKKRLLIPSIPNLFTVLCDDFNKLKNLFLKSENNIREVIRLAKNFLKDKEGLKEEYLQYLDNFIEFYWAITEIEIKQIEREQKKYFDPELYKNAFSELQNILAYRKQIRNYNYDEPNIKHSSKCTMCGLRPAIDSILSKNILKENEKLCAVCLLKRKFMEFLIEKEEGIQGFSYPSLAGIAAKNFIKENKLKLIEKIKNFRELLIKKIENNILSEQIEILNNIDENLEKCLENAEAFYPEFYDEIITKIKDQEIKNASKEIKKDLKDTPKYICSIMMDGDDMGKWVSGEKVKKLSVAYHKTLSRILSNLANYIFPEIAEKNNAQIIYAGGDDLFAFCAVENLFSFINNINEAFKSKEYRGVMSMGPDATFSMGVCIANYGDNLKTIIEKTREAEKIAKNFRKEKNAVCMYLIKSSGDEKIGVVGLQDFNDLNKIKEKFKENKISNNLFYSLSEFERYVNDKNLLDDFYYDDLFRIIKRHIYTKKIINKTKPEDNIKNENNEKEEIFQIIKNFINKNKIYSFINLSELLKIISFIARGE